MKKIRIGCGGGWERDRLEPAVDLAERGDIRYLCFDTLAERTLSFAQLRKLQDPNHGYNPDLEKRMEALLPICSEKGIRLIGNWGAANPVRATEVIMEIARKKGIKGIKIGTITGDDVFGQLDVAELPVLETNGKVKNLEGKIVSANTYIGIEKIVEALRLGADVIVGGRIADSSLFLAPMVYEFGWPLDAWDHLAAGQMIGHLLECSSQITGGNFADPGYCEVPDLFNLGNPFVDVYENGEAVISKLEGTGGMVSVNTCKLQTLYELHDPANYICPDVVIDCRQTKFEELSKDHVKVTGTRGKPRPEMLKVLVGMLEGCIAEAEMSFAGPGAFEISKLFLDTIRIRLEDINRKEGGILETRFDIIGVNSIFGAASPTPIEPPYDLRTRFAARCVDKRVANLVADEGQYGIGFMSPAGAGGVRTGVRDILAVYTSFIPREAIKLDLKIEEV
ncbi:MAG: acyclic terpene utilization AtuA family protein [Bacillota bacterium]